MVQIIARECVVRGGAVSASPHGGSKGVVPTATLNASSCGAIWGSTLCAPALMPRHRRCLALLVLPGNPENRYHSIQFRVHPGNPTIIDKGGDDGQVHKNQSSQRRPPSRSIHRRNALQLRVERDRVLRCPLEPRRCL